MTEIVQAGDGRSVSRDTSGYRRVQLPRVVPDPDNPDHGYKQAMPPRQAGLRGRYGLVTGRASEAARAATDENYGGVEQ